MMPADPAIRVINSGSSRRRFPEFRYRDTLIAVLRGAAARDRHSEISLTHAARKRSYTAVISTDASQVTLHVIPTDEELMIARSTLHMLRNHVSTKNTHP